MEREGGKNSSEFITVESVECETKTSCDGGRPRGQSRVNEELPTGLAAYSPEPHLGTSELLDISNDGKTQFNLSPFYKG